MSCIASATGRTFTTRDVVAYQSGEAIFNLSCSFVKPEEGISHQEAAPVVPGPEGMPPWEFVRPDQREQREMIRRWERESPVEIRAADPDGPPPGDTPRRRVWMRVRGELPDEPEVHAAMLAYASDRGLIATARMPHGIGRANWGSASLDHAIWFHRPPRLTTGCSTRARAPSRTPPGPSSSARCTRRTARASPPSRRRD